MHRFGGAVGVDAVDELIAAYRAAVVDDRGESYGRCRIVGQLEDHLSDDRTLTFFLALVSDPQEHDLARVDALKILEVWEPDDRQTRQRVGLAIAAVLESEKDVLVRQWAAIAAGSYTDVPEVASAVTGVLLDRHVDLDVRYNCLAAIEKVEGPGAGSATLNRLMHDPELSAAVRRIIRERP
jgi:hypothetical protein